MTISVTGSACNATIQRCWMLALFQLISKSSYIWHSRIVLYGLFCLKSQHTKNVFRNIQFQFAQINPILTPMFTWRIHRKANSKMSLLRLSIKVKQQAAYWNAKNEAQSKWIFVLKGELLWYLKRKMYLFVIKALL